MGSTASNFYCCKQTIIENSNQNPQTLENSQEDSNIKLEGNEKELEFLNNDKGTSYQNGIRKSKYSRKTLQKSDTLNSKNKQHQTQVQVNDKQEHSIERDMLRDGSQKYNYSRIGLNSKSYYQGRKNREEMVMLVQDIMNQNEDVLYNASQQQYHFSREGQNFEQGGQAHHDRLRKLFSKRLQRSPKTPPRRVHTDQASNSLLLDPKLDHHSLEALSLFIPENSDKSLLYTTSKQFAFTEQSKLLGGKLSQLAGRVEESGGSEEEEDEIQEAQEKQKIYHKKKKREKKESNMLLKIKSAGVLPRTKKREKSKHNFTKEKAKAGLEDLKEEQKIDSLMKPSQKIITKGVLGKKKKGRKNTKQQQQQQQQMMDSPKKSARRQNIIRSGSVVPGSFAIGMVAGATSQQEDESRNNVSLGLSLDSYKDNGQDNILMRSINSSNMPILNNKTRTLGNLGKKMTRKHKNSLSKKAQKMALNAQKLIINYWNIFVQDKKNYQNYYKTIKKIGQGGCGEVLMVMHLATDQIRAMKVIKKNSEKVVTSVFDEIRILKQLDHPNIVKIYEYFQDDQNVYIIQEYLKGGNLFDRLKAITRFGEREAAYIMKQVLQALNYCYQKKIVHRDMKLENILFVQEDSLQVKIIDFGSAIYFNTEVKNLNRIVTAYYVAPEIINKEAAIQKCDVWSCGVILFILLSGQAPFRGKDEQEILERVVKAQVNFEENQWKTVSSRSKGLIKQMIEINIKNRLSLVQCIQSSWIKMLTKIDGSFRIDMHQIAKTLRLLESFQTGCKLRLLCLHFAINYFSFESQIDKYSKYYAYMDSRHIANLNERDFMKFAQRIHKEEDLEVLLQQQKQTVAKLDLCKTGGITFSDFLVGTLDFTKILTSQKLIKLFNLIDLDGDNYITARDLWAFTSRKIELDHCKFIIEEALEYLNGGIPGYRGVSNAGIIEQRINFSNFKNIILLQRQVNKPEDRPHSGLQVQPQAQNTVQILNGNSYLMIVDAPQRAFNGTQGEILQQPQIHNNNNASCSGILYNAGVNSNTGQIPNPTSKLLNENKDSAMIKKKQVNNRLNTNSKKLIRKAGQQAVLSQFAQQ